MRPIIPLDNAKKTNESRENNKDIPNDLVVVVVVVVVCCCCGGGSDKSFLLFLNKRKTREIKFSCFETRERQEK